MTNPLQSLVIDYWYKAVTVASVAFLLVALTVDLKGVQNKGARLENKGARLEYHAGTTRSISDYPESAKWRCFNFFAGAGI